MPFIGKPPAVGAYSVLDALTASATANYSLQLDGAAFVPNSVNQLLVSLNGVIQKPGSSFTVSGSTLTFKNGGSDQALTSSDSIDFIISMGGDPLNVGVVSDGTVTNAKITGMAASKLTGALPAIDGSALTGQTVTLLNTTTSTDGVNTIELNDIFSTTYRYYKIVCTDLALKEGTGGEYDGDAKLECRIKLSGQSSYDTGGSAYIRRIETFSNANANYSGANTTGSSWVITPSGAVEDGQYNSMPMNVEFTVYNPSSTNSSQGVYIRYESDYVSYHPYRIGNRGHLFHTSNNWTGLSLFWAGSGHFHAGAVFKVYGFK